MANNRQVSGGPCLACGSDGGGGGVCCRGPHLGGAALGQPEPFGSLDGGDGGGGGGGRGGGGGSGGHGSVGGIGRSHLGSLPLRMG